MKFRLLTLLLFACALFFTFSCNSPTNKNQDQDKANPDLQFDNFKKAWVEKLWKLNPDWASSPGFHNYDSVLIINNSAWRQRVAATYKNMRAEMAKYKPADLSVNNRTDYQLMVNYLDYATWQDNTFRSYEWDASNYNIGGSVAEILNGRYAPLETRLQAISHKLRKAPLYYENAIASLKTPTLEHTNLAIIQNRGALSVFGKAMLDSVAASSLKPRDKILLEQRIATAKVAIEGYVNFLENELLPKLKKGKAKSFRIGEKLFNEKFRYEIMASHSPEQIYQKALARKEMLHRQMVKLSKQLWPKYFPQTTMPADSLETVRKMISKLAEKHVAPDSFVTAIRHQLPELIKFVNDKNLLTQDPSRPLVVRETQLYMRGGGAGASVSAPGPYDKKADTYYNVTPLDGYTPAQAESYLREYNNYTLQILNIHEAIPGHYTQLVYGNKTPSIVKAVLGNNAMIEGWAVYAELMMLENGYKNSPEMWLMYYKWNLRVTLNAILDQQVQVQGLSEKEAMKMLQQEGFQEEAEAKGKWTRACLSQVQLSSYFTGFTEIYDLREELKKKQGKNFNLKKFHEQFLSYGNAPVKFIREMML